MALELVFKCLINRDTVYWEIFETQNFRGLVIFKFFANKFSRMAIKARSGHVNAFKILSKFAKACIYSSGECVNECFLTYICICSS